MKQKILLSLAVSLIMSATYGQFEHYLYFTDRDVMTTRYLNVDDPSTITDFPFTNLDKPYGIVADTVNNYLFVSDATAGKIYRYNFEGTHALTILDVTIDPVVDYPYGLAMYNNQLYWGREGGICRADIDGSNPELWLEMDLVSPPEMPIGLAYNPDDDKMYFTNDKYDYSGGVYRVNMDGTGLEKIVDGTDGVAIAIDWEHDKIYYCDYLKGVCYNEYDGTSEGVIDDDYVEAVIWGLAIDMYGGYIYYTDKYDDKIVRAELDGLNKIDFVSGVNAHALAWYSEDATGIAGLPGSREARIFPNPATEYINIMDAGAYEQAVVMSITGQLVGSYEITDGTSRIPAEGLEEGVYFISLRGADAAHTEKILVR